MFLLITLSILYYVVNNYKEISVSYLFGYKSIEVSMHLIKKYILLFVNSWEILKEYSYLGISSSEEIDGKENMMKLLMKYKLK